MINWHNDDVEIISTCITRVNLEVNALITHKKKRENIKVQEKILRRENGGNEKEKNIRKSQKYVS